MSTDLSSLQSIMSGGEANLVSLASRFQKRLQNLGAHGPIIRIGYGLTEACAALSYGWFNPEYEAQENHEFCSIGTTILGAKMRICTQDGHLARPYELGFLDISGPVSIVTPWNYSFESRFRTST